MNDQTKGLLITLFGVLLVVPDSLFVRLITAEPLTIAFWRVTLVGVAIGLGLVVTQGIAPFRDFAKTGLSGSIYVLGLGSSGVMFVLAVSLTSVANVVFIIASLPVFAMIFSRVFLYEPISPRMYLTIAAVLPGLAVIAYGSGETENAALAGDLMAFAVSAAFAASLTAARHARGTSMVPGVALGYVLAGMAILPWVDPFTIPSIQVPLVMMHAAFILLSSILLALGPRYITSAEVGLLILLESVFAPLLAWYVIGEDPGIYTVLGGAIVVGTLVVSNVIVLRRVRLGNH